MQPLLSHNGRSDRYDTVRYQRIPQDFPIEIMPAESRHGEISLSDLGLRVTTSIDSHLEYGGQWIVTMENKITYSLQKSKGSCLQE